MFKAQTATWVINEAEESPPLRDVIGEPARIAPVEAISAAAIPAATDARGKLAAFLTRLRGMSKSERILASRYQFSLWERNVWTAHYAEEVPRINGEFEWIAATLADNE